MAETIVETRQIVSAAATWEEVALNPRSTQRRIRWTRLVAHCTTSKCDNIELGVKQGSTRYPLKVSGETDDPITVDTDVPIDVPGNWRPYARWGGSGSGDILVFLAFGYYVESDDE